MFFWNSLAFSMIQQMLAIWSLVPLPFLKPAWTSGVVPRSRNPTKHHRSRGSMQKQWGTLLQARAGTLFTQWRKSPPWKRRIIFILYSRGSRKGSLRGLVNSSTKGVLLATDWWVKSKGEGPSCWLAEFHSLYILFSLLGRGFYSKWRCYPKMESFGFHISHFPLF